MSGSTARKVQPFTISTKLSLPKCAADFPGDACPGIAFASALDNHHRGLRRSLNERISLYLAQARASPAAPEGHPRSPSPGEDGGTDEERLNRNSLARSIKKITLSNWHGEAGAGDAGGHGDPARTGGERNHNNNNSRPGKAQLKVSAPRTLRHALPAPVWFPVPGCQGTGRSRGGCTPAGHPCCLVSMPSRQHSLQGSWGSCFSSRLPPSPCTFLYCQAGGQEIFAGEVEKSFPQG